MRCSALGHEDDLVRLVARVEALQAFLKTDDGANLLAGYKRAANILKAEEKKDGKTFISEVSETLLSEPAGKSAVCRAGQGQSRHRARAGKRRFRRRHAADGGLARSGGCVLRGVKVNADDPTGAGEPAEPAGLALRAALHQVADFSNEYRTA